MESLTIKITMTPDRSLSLYRILIVSPGRKTADDFFDRVPQQRKLP
jgi:hypothetical protein